MRQTVKSGSKLAVLKDSAGSFWDLGEKTLRDSLVIMQLLRLTKQKYKRSGVFMPIWLTGLLQRECGMCVESE